MVDVHPSTPAKHTSPPPHVTPAAKQPSYDPSYRFDPLTGQPLPPPIRKSKDGKELKASDGLYDHLIGTIPDLNPGDVAWLLLDDTGAGVSLQKDPPDFGIPACPVYVSQQGDAFHGLVSITGADLGASLQPRPEFRVPQEGSPPPAEVTTGWISPKPAHTSTVTPAANKAAEQNQAHKK
jgi:hypothetical protein